MISKVLKKDKLYKKQSRKRSKIHFAFFLLLFIILTDMTNIALAAVISPTSDFYVNDNARILTTATKQYIMNTNVELQKKTGAQIVVVTVKSLDGMSIEDYANQLFNSWGIGDKNKDNGLLLLCSYGDRKFRVEVGYGLEGKLPDGKTGRIQDEYIIPYLREDKFDEGIKNGYSAFLKEVADEYRVTITGSEEAVRKGLSQESKIMMYFMFAVIVIVWMIIRIKFRGRRGPFISFGGSGGFHGGGSSSGGGFRGGGGHSGGGGSSRSF